MAVVLKIALVSWLVSLSIAYHVCKLVNDFSKVHIMERRDSCATIANNERKQVMNKFDVEG